MLFRSKEKLYRIFQKHYQKDSTSIFQIEAHTDFAQSPSEKYPTTWHLAAVRALRVLDFLFEESDEFDPSRFCIVSFGAYQPKFQYAKGQVELEENRRLEVRMFQTPGGKTNDR